MQKFQFKLESVMSYKNQVLETEKNEHAKALAEVRRKEEVISSLKFRYKEVNDEFNAKKKSGITILEGNIFIATLDGIDRELKKAHLLLEKYKLIEEEKRQIMLATKIETASLEKLKEKKYEEYLEGVKKSEELFIEEFVSQQRVARQTG